MSDSPYCVLCPDRERIPYRSPVCESCRAWLASILGDLGDLALELVADPDPMPDERIGLAVDNDALRKTGHRYAWRDLDDKLIVRHRDPVHAAVPSGMVRHPGDLPINVDAVDISAPARQAARALMVSGYGADTDQVGHLPLATTLDTWIRDWRDVGAPGDQLPDARVAPMLNWLTIRLEWACDQHPGIDEFAGEMRQYRSTIRGILGLIDLPDYKQGVACPRCRARALYQRHGGPRDGNLWIECAECPAILSPGEYAEHVAELQRRAVDVTVAMLARAIPRRQS